jgi:pyruvate,water dikinase
MSGKFDSNLKTEIIEAFATLKSKFGAVSVRSSATCEDSKNASFAGQFETYLFVNDQKTLIDYVKKCWASFFRSGAILYAMNHGIDLSKSQMAVVVQGMINSDVAGVMFTKNNGNAGVVIEAAKGVGENVVSGNVKPDEYEINPDSFRIKSEIKQNQRLLSNPEIVSLTALGIKIEKLFNFPQDIEWAIQNKAVYILQTRPITV